MAEERPSLHIDTDWKKQAQEEKRRLAEEQQKRPAAAAAQPPAMTPGMVGVGPAAAAMAPAAPDPATAAATTAGAPANGAGAGAEARRGALPQANLGTLVQSLVTQALFYLGDLSHAGAQPVLNLDMAKHQIDTLTVLEEKTANNLTDDERHLLDAALYEARTRYIAVASQFI